MSGAPLNPADYLPELLGPVVIEVDGVEQPARGTINFADCTASGDDDTLTITPNGGGGSAADGDAGELQTTDGDGALVAATGVKAGAGLIAYGATPASVGQLRFTYDTSTAFVRNATDDGDLCVWDANGDDLYLGTDRTFAKTFDTFGLAAVNLGGLYLTSTAFTGMFLYSAAASGLANPSIWISNIPEIRNIGTAQTIAYAREDELHTTDAADHALLSVTVAPDSNAGIILDVVVLGVEAGAASMHWYKKSRAWLNTAGVLTAGVQKDVDDEEIGTPPAGTWTVTLADDGSQGLLVNVNSDDDDVTWYVVSQRLRTVPVA